VCVRERERERKGERERERERERESKGGCATWLALNSQRATHTLSEFWD